MSKDKDARVRDEPESEEDPALSKAAAAFEDDESDSEAGSKAFSER